MKSVYVCLPQPERVQAFVEVLSGLEGDFDLVSGEYILDARSLMGIFSLDLTKPIELRVYNDSAASMKALAPFVAQKGDGCGQ